MMRKREILAVVLTLVFSSALALLFDPDPCPNASCSCDKFSVMCSELGLTDVPAFSAVGVTYSHLDLSRNNITAVPSEAFVNVSAMSLDLSHNPLTAVADDAFRGLESMLEMLNLEHCGLTEVPIAVGLLRKLKVLNLRHNPAITFLPGNVLASIGLSLETLDFSNTGINTWPLGLTSSIRLKKVLASGNHLTSIPNNAFMPFAATLEYLDISYNALRAFPDAINDLRVLKHLDLSFNLLGTIPAGKFIYSRRSLQTLYLVHTMLRKIPDGLKDLAALQNLYLSYNPIVNYTNDVFQGRISTSLKVLHLDKTLLTEIPTALTYLTALKELNFTWNRIQYLENYALDLHNLEVLYLDKNPISNIKFAAFSGLPSLKKLYMRNTSLAFVPNAALAQAKNLSLVDMSFNHFQALYDYGFPGMGYLKELVMSGNPLVNISNNAFVDLTGVQVLNLENCLLTGIPKSVQQMHALRVIKIDGNNINCTCDNLGWVEGWRSTAGLIAKVEGQCANETLAIQYFMDNEGRSCS